MNPKLISMCGECGEFPALRTVAIDCLTGEPIGGGLGGPLGVGDLVSYTEVLVCAAGVSLIRRTAADGTITFVGTNGAAVAVPGPYTIGECPPVAAAVLGDDCENPLYVDVCTPNIGYTEVLICVDGTTLIRRTAGDGSLTFVSTNGAEVGEPASYTIGQCPVAGITISTEIYRLDGTVVATTATPSTAPASTPVVGNTVTISAPYKALSWRWMRDTLQDGGAGATAQVTINGFVYYPGVGTVYSEQGWSVQSAAGESFSNDHTFTALGDAYIEIVVIR